MAYYARVIEGQVVKVHVLANAVITDDEGVEHEELGQEFLADLHGYSPTELVQCSYNTRGGVHYDPETGEPSEDQSKALRFNYAGVGFSYDEARDAFIPPKPFESWVLDEDTCLWEAPIPMPTEGDWVWDEQAGAWVEA
jgi:hypothetical protein